ncbi:MAG: hypothetical protein ACJ746_25080 [Bryobacteraceae bacterium]
MIRQCKYLLVIIAAVVLDTAVPFTVCAQQKEELPRNAQLSSEAFKHLEHKQYDEAIEVANECIVEFGKQAERDEKELEDAHAELPGKDVTVNERAKILKRGVLNDAASCYFIKGEANRFRHKRKEALDAYRQAARFTYARTLDPKTNSLWSPAQAASDRIEVVESK